MSLTGSSEPLAISAYTVTASIGRGNTAVWDSIVNESSGLSPCDFEDVDLETYIGKLQGVDTKPVIEKLTRYDCRNNRIAQIAIQQDKFPDSVNALIKKYGKYRIGVLIGTSTSGIAKLETDYRHLDRKTGDLPDDGRVRETHNLFSAADFVRAYFGLQGPAVAISTACSSSAKVFAAAHRWINCGICDAAIVGGVDSLCLNTLYGFDSLQLLSRGPCKPFAVDRSGISIGEGAAFAILEKMHESSASGNLGLYGYGETTDGFHMSSPSPKGEGAASAMETAIKMAGLSSQEIDYVNLHGTGSDANDIAENAAVMSVMGGSVPCSATKGWFGHTLGAAGAIESALCMLALDHNAIPGTQNTETVDPAFDINLITGTLRQDIRYVLKNSFGFGGNNCSLVFGKT